MISRSSQMARMSGWGQRGENMDGGHKSDCFSNEKGQFLAEYALMLSLFTVVVISAMLWIGRGMWDQYCQLVTSFAPEACGAEAPLAAEEDDRSAEATCITFQKDTGGSVCDQSGECSLLPGLNSGSYTANREIGVFVISAGTDYQIYGTGLTDDVCYTIEIQGSKAIWTRTGNGIECQDISYIQSWYIPSCEIG
ncbi:MAG: hypothetical protein GTO18_15980 [Anaerolineales bacterium]|nr:hypothetical protein [Anaerolineales bacterium]